MRRLWAGDASLWTETDEAQLARLARHRRRAAEGGRPPRGVRRRRQARRVQRRAAARHGRLEPRPRGAGRDLRHQARLSASCSARTRPTRRRSAASRARSICSARCSSCRASRAARSNPTSSSNISSSGPSRRSARRGGAQAFRRDHRSRLVARKDRAAEGFRARLPRRADDRRPLFGAVGFRHGAGRGDRHRRREPSSNARPRWCAPARRARRRSRTPACSSARSSASPAQQGRDKLTIIASPGIAAFGAWLEQLLAESTGKHGKGIVPVDAEPLGAPAVYGNDRLFAYLRLASDQDQRAGAARSPRSKRPGSRSCASSSRTRCSSARNSSAGRWRPRSPARSSASTRSTSPMSRRRRSRPAS